MQAVEQAIEATTSALEMLRAPMAGDDVEGHRAYSDERLKQAITQTESALQALRALPTAANEDDVEAHRFRWG